MTMKLKFKKQAYQTAAVEAVANCFIGQPFATGLNYRIDPGRARDSSQLTIAATEELTGIKNSDIAFPLPKLLENIQSVQRGQNLPISSALVKSPICDVNLDVETDTVSFTNGQQIRAGEALGDVLEITLRRIQIREAIKAHLEKEQALFDQGIKVLTLFFIDEVATILKPLRGMRLRRVFAHRSGRRLTN